MSPSLDRSLKPQKRRPLNLTATSICGSGMGGVVCGLGIGTASGGSEISWKPTPKKRESFAARRRRSWKLSLAFGSSVDNAVERGSSPSSSFASVPIDDAEFARSLKGGVYAASVAPTESRHTSLSRWSWIWINSDGGSWPNNWDHGDD